MISIAILNEKGQILFRRVVNPGGKISDTQDAIHGIGFDQITDSVFLKKYKARLESILRNQKILGFAVKNDLQVIYFLLNNLSPKNIGFETIWYQC